MNSLQQMKKRKCLGNILSLFSTIFWLLRYILLESCIESQNFHNKKRTLTNTSPADTPSSPQDIFQQAIQSFNRNPKKVSFQNSFIPEIFLQGLSLLISKGYVQDGVEDVAKFLFEEKTLKRSAIGEFLGSGYIWHWFLHFWSSILQGKL